MGHDRKDTSGGKEEDALKGREILRRLMGDPSLKDGLFLIDVASPGCSDPFRALVATVLSQNTSDRNGLRALRSLESRVGVGPKELAEASIELIEESIRPAGMYRERARRLKELAAAIIERYGGDLSRVLSKGFEDARAELMSLPGVGPKTADVVLLFCAHAPTFPVDTHIFRVSRRLGLSRGRGYEEVRSALQAIFDPEDYAIAHRALIQLGRVYCRARSPRCGECPLRDLCPSAARGREENAI